MEQNQHVCDNCESEFIVDILHSEQEYIKFCPICGSKFEHQHDDSEEDDEYY